MAGLRRDRLLFALLGTVILVLNSLQPLAAANATALSGLGIICSGDHVAADRSGDGQPSHAPGSTDCPCCIGGVCPMVAGPAKAVLDESLSFDPTPSGNVESIIFRSAAASRSPSPLRYLAPIRAPPLFA